MLVPFFAWALLIDGGESALWRTVAWVIFAVAMITDKIDGDIARSRNLITDFGKIADPIADKAITGMAFIGLSIVGDIWWWVTILVLLREWSVTLLRLSVLQEGRDRGQGPREAQDDVPGAGARRRSSCRCATPDLPSALQTPGEVVFYVAAGVPRRRRRADPVVGLRVLPRRVEAARQPALSRARLPGTGRAADQGAGASQSPSGRPLAVSAPHPSRRLLRAVATATALGLAGTALSVVAAPAAHAADPVERSCSTSTTSTAASTPTPRSSRRRSKACGQPSRTPAALGR